MTQRRQSFNILPQSSARPTLDIESGMFTSTPHDTIHTMFAPLHYESGYSYPLVVWLHGPGNDERQLLRVMPLVSMRNFVGIAPRGTLLQRPGEPKEIFGWSHCDEHLQQAEQRIFDSIELASNRFNVNGQRIFLVGFDSGGTMAFRIAMNYPHRFAGVVSLGGAFPTGQTPLANLPQARQLPVFLAAGRRSPTYGETDVCGDLRLLHTAGVSITLRLYPCGHELSPQMLSDVDRWIIEQIASPTQSAQSGHQCFRDVGGDSTNVH